MKKNIYDIAKEAKVSIATISRVLNNSPLVNDETRNKVKNILKKHDYSPKIVKNKITNITILLNGVDFGGSKHFFGIYESEILNGITETVGNLNLNSTLIGCSNDWPGYKVLKLVRERYSDGVIVLLSNKDTKYLKVLNEHGIPFILINNSAQKNFNFIDVDNRQACRRLMEHVNDHGHTNIAFLAALQAYSDHKERLDEYINFHKDKGLQLNENLIVYADKLSKGVSASSYEHGYLLTQQLLNSKEKFTAIVVSNSEMAFGTYRALGEAGKKIPDDISVAAFDNYPYADYFYPPLTTIGQPLKQLGEQAVLKVLGLINNSESKGRLNIIMDSQLVTRQSLKHI